MLGKEITVKGKEYLKYYIAEYEDQVNICYKEGEVRWGDKSNYFIKRAVFDASYDAETNTIDPENLAYVAPTVEEQNAAIRIKREKEYKKRSDSLYMAWQKYLALGEEEKAAEAKAQWLAEVEKINEEFPYVK